MHSRTKRILNMVSNHGRPENNNTTTTKKREQYNDINAKKDEEDNKSIHSFDTNSIADSQHNLSFSILESSNESFQSQDGNIIKRPHITIKESDSGSSDTNTDSESQNSTTLDSITDYLSDDSVKDPDFQISSRAAEVDTDTDDDLQMNSNILKEQLFISPIPGTSRDNNSPSLGMQHKNNTQPPSIKITFPSVETAPPCVETGPACIETAPPSVETAPPSVETGPSSIETAPPSIETEPTSVEPSENVIGNQKKSRKRKANPELWQKNLNKSLKNMGKAYKSMAKSRKVVEAKKIGPTCSEKCKLKCSSEFTMDQRKIIFDEYWETGDLEVQRKFISDNMVAIEPKYRYTRVGSTRKNLNHAYYLHRNGKKIRVCKVFFMNTFAISDKTIRTVVSKKSNSKPGFVQLKDNRGKHNNRNKLDTQVTDAVKSHINSIPRIESHYCRARTQREFIEGGTNVATLHRHYVEDCKSKGLQHVSYQIYYNIFINDFNISFWTPKKDQCEDCTSFNNAEDKTSLQEQYDFHLKQKSLARAEKERDKENVTENYVVAVYDLQAVMPCPKGEVSSFYYISKLNLLNFTITELATKNTICYVWHEGEGSRGANEIGSCVFMYLKNLNERATHDFDVVFYSDNCCGQQKNKFMLAMYQYAVNVLPKLRSVTHKFLIKGHTQNEGDSVYSNIQRNISRALKSSPIYVPDQYITLIKTAKKKGEPYTVKELEHDSFFDLKSLAVGNYSIAEDGTKLKWSDIKIMKTGEKHSNKFLFKTSYEDEEFKCVYTLKKRQPKSDASKPTELKKLYSQKLKVSETKKQGILNLINKNVIPKYYEAFYSHL